MTAWAVSSDPCLALGKFGHGKTMQSLGRHGEALVDFDEVVRLQEDNAHAYFRRAWSHKALQNLENAASDFEKAKSLCPTDPNFFISYKQVHIYEYVEVNSEPDLLAVFPLLLPAS